MAQLPILRYLTTQLSHMKTLTARLLFIGLLYITLTLSISCKKEKKVDQLSLLPAATQTGANTFGCLINGMAFTPRRDPDPFHSASPALAASYKYDYGKKAYAFTIGTSHYTNSNNIKTIGIVTDSLKIHEGETLLLSKVSTPGFASAGYLFNTSDYDTNDNATGQLTITHLDTVRQIISGTFNFKAVGRAGDTVRITNGRFDVHYPLGNN